MAQEGQAITQASAPRARTVQFGQTAWAWVGVTPFFTSSEVGQMQELAGQPKTVQGTTGLWYFPGMFILVGPIIWFVKTNGALNEYWKSQGAPA